MKISPVNYDNGTFALEVVAETPVETAVLRQIFTHGEMQRGNGNSLLANGMSTGFYLATSKKEPPA